MTYQFVQGDLFDTDPDVAIGHGCNTKGLMGAGIAALFSSRYPDMYEEYRRLCWEREYQPGDAMAWFDEDSGRWIYNLASQVNPGADARLDLLDEALKNMRAHALLNNVKHIALPQIGCGIGGLEWDDVEKLIQKHADEGDVDITVYYL